MTAFLKPMLPKSLKRKLGSATGGLVFATLALAGASPAAVFADTTAPHLPEHVTTAPSGHVARARDAFPIAAPAVGATTPAATPKLAVGGSSAAPFLTRPYLGWHSLNSYFDHCSPDYGVDGRICTVDGIEALRSNGYDPTFPKGYAATYHGTDYVYYDGHNGYDIGLVYEELIAAASGTVIIAGTDGNNPCFGLNVSIDHGNGFTTRYAHMSQVDVSAGQVVQRGQHIGISGTSGCSTGPHLHFGVYTTSPWNAIDPWGWLGAAGADPYPYDVGDLWLTGNPRDPIPDPPTGVIATVGNRSATVSWTAPAFDGGTPLSSYTVSALPGGAIVTVPATQTSATITGLTNGSTYTFTVVANGRVSSPPSQPSGATVLNINLPGTWETLGGVIVGGASVVVPATNNFAVFARGTDNSLYQDIWDGTKWSGWFSLGGILASAPAAISRAPNTIDVFVRGIDDRLWKTSFDGVRWSNWETLGGVLTSAPTVASWGPNRLDVFVRGTDKGMWHTWSDGSGWAAWEGHGGVLTGPPSATAKGLNRIDVMVLGTDSGLWLRSWNGLQWSGWFGTAALRMGSPAIVSAPSLTSPTADTLEVEVIAADGAAWRTVFDGSAWNGWKSLGGAWYGAADYAPTVVRIAPATTHLFLRTNDGQPFHWVLNL